MKTLQVIMESKDLDIKKRTFNFSDDTAEGVFVSAICFAEGLAHGMGYAYPNEEIETPCVKTTDGFHWWMRRNDFTIKVVNDNGAVIKKPEDVI